MDDLDVGVGQFTPVRARYLQVIYDSKGAEEVQSSGIVHLEVDRAIHSGVWDGQFPAQMDPFRDPGLVIDWKIQNSIYNAFDRVLTDGRLSTILRYMPFGAYGLRVAAVIGDQHTLVMAAPDSGDTSVPVTRIGLPGGAVNVLTVPYVLAAMDLRPGDRFTLPGFALFGGPDGTGVRWRGAFEVQEVTIRDIRGERHIVTEVVQRRINTADRPTADDLTIKPGQRLARLLISESPPYLIGRGDYLAREGKEEVSVREHLDVVDWAAIPLPAADLLDPAIWELDLESELFKLAPEHTPAILVPRN